MISFLIALATLILGYIFYSKIVSRIAGQDPARKTPVHTMADGVDYVRLPSWKIFLIQFLNIAGLGPIFGAIMPLPFVIPAILTFSPVVRVTSTAHSLGNVSVVMIAFAAASEFSEPLPNFDNDS